MNKEEKFQEWKEQAIKTQQMFYISFGDKSWDEYQPSERHLLKKNVGYALYGQPEAMPSIENDETGYCGNKLEHIKRICDLIVRWDQHEKKTSETQVAVLIVCLNENDKCCSMPVFRVPRYVQKGECSTFIDHTGCVYKGWTSFLTTNRLNKCRYCYPKDGIYVGDENYDVQLEFGDTPACKPSRKALEVLDITNMGVAIGGTVIGLASLTALPIAAPIIAVSSISSMASFLYSTTRSVGTLIDKKKHGQSIGLHDGEARCCYVSMMVGALGAASGIGSQWVARVAQSGELVSNTSKIVVTALNISSLATNGYGLLSNFFLLREKYKTGEMSCLDVFQFTSSVLFFTSAIVNVKTANTIIKETQESTLNNFEESLQFKKHKKLYHRMAKNTLADADDQMYGKSKVIKAIQHIDNPEEFFSNINKARRDLHETNTDISFGESGTLTLNKEAHVDPAKFSALQSDERLEFLNATKDLKEGTLFRTEFRSLVQQNEVPVELPCNSAGTSGVVVAGKESSLTFSELVAAGETHMNSLLKCALSLKRSDYQELLYYAETLAREMGFHKAADVLNTLNFIIDFINDVAIIMENGYQQDLRQAKESIERFSQHSFDEKYRTLENRMKVFSKVIMKNLDKLFVVMKRVYSFVSKEPQDEKALVECGNLVFENMPRVFTSVPEEMDVEHLPFSQVPKV